MPLQPLLERIRSRPWKTPPFFNRPLSRLTTIKTGGVASVVVNVSDEAELAELVQWVREANVPFMILGKGSNLVFTDDGFQGVLAKLHDRFNRIEYSEGVLIAGAGVSDAKFSRTARNLGLAGAEFLSTVPGSIGGAVFMNAGAHGADTSGILQWTRWIDEDSNIVVSETLSLHFSYRKTSFMENCGIVLEAGFALRESTPEEVQKTERSFQDYRLATQPIKELTWGSVFVNPPGDSAGRLIESCGLKGRGFGEARISPMHGNFIENTGSAVFGDVRKTIRLAIDQVREKHGVQLELEVRVIGPRGESVEI